MSSFKPMQSTFTEFDHSSYISIVSNYNFYELLLQKAYKCMLLQIPQTILFFEGNIKSWIFNSCRSKTPEILIKKHENLTFQTIYNEFFNTYDEEAIKLKLDSQQNLAGYQPIAYIEYWPENNNKKIAFLNANDLFQALTEQKSRIKCIQSFISSSKPSLRKNGLESLYCERRNSDDKRIYIHYKKFAIYEFSHDNPHSKDYYPVNQRKNKYIKKTPLIEVKRTSIMKKKPDGKPSIYTPDKAMLYTPIYINDNAKAIYTSDGEEKMLKMEAGKKKEVICRNFDNKLCERIEALTEEIIEKMRFPGYIIRKITIKFLYESNVLLFKGIKDIYIEFYGPLKDIAMEDKSIEYEKFKEFLEGVRPRKEFSVKTIKAGFKGIFSQNLRETMLEEICQGDFCEYVALKQIKGGLEELPYSKYLSEEQRNNFNKNKDLLFDSYSPKQPYQISNLLLKKIYENQQFIRKILKENEIIPKNLLINKDGLLSELPSPGLLPCFKEIHKLNKKNLIKFVKICSNCFFIYNFLHQKLDQTEQKLLSYPSSFSTSWVHREKRFSNTFNESLKLRTAHQSLPNQSISKYGLLSRPITRPLPTPNSDIDSSELLLNFHAPQQEPSEYHAVQELSGFYGSRPNHSGFHGSQHNDESGYHSGLSGTQHTNKLINNYQNQDYSFLNKQTLSSHVLNLGFSSSFRSGFNMIRQEEDIHMLSADRKNNKLVNLYEVSNKTQELATAYLRKKGKFIDESPKIHSGEFQKRSSSEVLKLLNSPMSGTNLKQKRESIQQIITSKKIQARPSIIMKKRMSNMPSYLRNSLMSKQSMPFKPGDIASRYMPIFHRNMQLLRVLPSFRISTPKLSPLDGINPFLDWKERNTLEFDQLLKILKEELPSTFPHRFLDKIKVFICDETTAIPYIILGLKEKSLDIDLEVATHNDLGIKNIKEILIVCHDFFENFMDSLLFYESFLCSHPELLIILFNYPGQAYTYFDEKKIYNNEYNSQLLDLLLYELQKNDLFFIRSDNFRFLGFGNGGNILSYFLCMNDNSIINFKYLMLFNSFLYIDDLLADLLNKSIEVFMKCPLETPELAFLYEETLNKQLDKPPNYEEIKEKALKNPISIKGRISILQGALESINISQNVAKLKIPIRIIHSQQNPLINVTHLDLLLKDMYNKDISNNTSKVIFMKNITSDDKLKEWLLKGGRSAMILEQGGYNLFDNQIKVISRIIQEYLNLPLKRNLTQRIAFIDRKISIIEKRIVSFFLIYVEKLIEFTENPFADIDEKTVAKIITWFEIYKPKFQKVNNEYNEISMDFDEIYEEYKNCKEKISVNNEEFDEFQERNEKTLNIQTKKFSDLKANLTRITQEFLNPFKNAMKGLFYYKLLIESDLLLAKINEGFFQLKSNFSENILEFEQNNESLNKIHENNNNEVKNNIFSQEIPSITVQNVDNKVKSLNISENNFIKPRYKLRKQSSLDEMLINNDKIVYKTMKKTTQNFLITRIQIAFSIKAIFEKLYYCWQAKAELLEMFSNEIEQFIHIETRILANLKIFYKDFINNENDFYKNIAKKPNLSYCLIDFFDSSKAFLQDSANFIVLFSIEKYEIKGLLETDSHDEDMLYTLKGSKEEFEEVTESNLSDKSSMKDNIEKMMGNMKNLKKRIKEYEEFIKINKEMIGKEGEFGEFYEEMLGRSLEKDLVFFSEIEKNINKNC